MNDRDRRITDHILRHCEEISDTVRRFDSSIKNFKRDHVFIMRVRWRSFRSENFPGVCQRTSKVPTQNCLGLRCVV